MLRLLAVALLTLPAFAIDRATCERPFEAQLASGADLRLEVRPGDIEIVGADAEAVNVTCIVRNGEDAGQVKIEFDSSGKAGTLRIHDGPRNDVRFRIQVPKRTHLYVRCPAGDLTLSGIRGDKDVQLRAGDLTISVGDPADYASVEASVTAGDIHASAFGVEKGGLFRSFNRTQENGRYRLREALGGGFDVAVSLLEFLGHAQDFVDRGHTVTHLQPAVFAQVAHAVAARGIGDRDCVGVAHHELA